MLSIRFSKRLPDRRIATKDNKKGLSNNAKLLGSLCFFAVIGVPLGVLSAFADNPQTETRKNH